PGRNPGAVKSAAASAKTIAAIRHSRMRAPAEEEARMRGRAMAGPGLEELRGDDGVPADDPERDERVALDRGREQRGDEDRHEDEAIMILRRSKMGSARPVCAKFTPMAVPVRDASSAIVSAAESAHAAVTAMTRQREARCQRQKKRRAMASGQV